MQPMKVAWNKKHTASVVLSKIKEFTIAQTDEKTWRVCGWYNRENSFLFGDDFLSHREAERFLQDIHDSM